MLILQNIGSDYIISGKGTASTVAHSEFQQPIGFKKKGKLVGKKREAEEDILEILEN